MKNKLEAAKEKDIVSYLKSQGYAPAHISGVTAQYYSPLKEERHPSLSVNLQNNRWKLWNEDNKYGDIIDMVMLLENCSMNEAIDRLLNKRHYKADIERHTGDKYKEVKESIHIEKVAEIGSIDLIGYLMGRLIDLKVAKKYYKEVTVTFPNSKKDPEKQHTLIGFKNNAGGYELRSSYLRVSSSPKDITTFKNKGKETYLFESNWDFTSFLSYFNVMSLPGTVHVLNGASMIGGLATFLKGKSLFYYGHLDPAGDRVRDTLLENDVRVVDCRHLYKGYNDWNDYVKSKV